jgi:hypothetical protein
MQHEHQARSVAEKLARDLERMRTGEAQASLAVGHFQNEVAIRNKRVDEKSSVIYQEYRRECQALEHAQAEAAEQNQVFRTGARRMVEELVYAQASFNQMLETDARSQQELARVQSELHSSGHYDEEHFVRYERVASRAVGDLRTELQATSHVAANQQQHFETLAEQSAKATSESEHLLQQRSYFEQSFQQIYQLHEGSRPQEHAKVRDLEHVLADQHAKAHSAFQQLQDELTQRITSVSRQQIAEAELCQHQQLEIQEYANEWAEWRNDGEGAEARAAADANAAEIERLYSSTSNGPADRLMPPNASIVAPAPLPPPVARASPAVGGGVVAKFGATMNAIAAGGGGPIATSISGPITAHA